MVKVCHMASAHNRYDGRIFRKECVSLANNGYEVYLVVNDSYGDEIKDRVKIRSTKLTPKNRFERMILSQKNIYKKAIEIDADIYHFHDPELLFLGLKLKKRGKKVIFDSHEGYFLQIKEKYYIPKLLRNFVANIYNIIETYICKRIDAVIVPCGTNGKTIFDGRAQLVECINNVPILDEFYNKYEEKENKNKDIICYTGAITYERGIEHIIKAAHKSNSRLILAGNIINNEFKSKIFSIPEHNCIDYKGILSIEEISDIYKCSYIGMCTILNVGQYNKGDNFATKVYEYMAMGIPAIISDSPYVQKIFSEYEFGIAVDPDSINDIVSSINYLKVNENIAKRMGENGRKAIAERFNWKIEEKKLLELYKKIV